MRVVRGVREMERLGGGNLGFVPTMGAFHEGHLALMRAARANHEQVYVSLFVNPLQFAKNEDLARYPRNEDHDFELAEAEGVDVMFAPTADEIYPRESTTIRVPEITDVWEGSFRHGHFDGVATVVAKLFNIVRPAVSYFGWKDLQQCLVIRRMVEDLNIPTRLSFLDTIREEDGLAMSSRNTYLAPAERAVAPILYGTLIRLADRFSESGLQPTAVELFLTTARQELTSKGFVLDYLECVDLVRMDVKRNPGDAALIVAARLGTTRLIDNVRFVLA